MTEAFLSVQLVSSIIHESSRYISIHMITMNSQNLRNLPHVSSWLSCLKKMQSAIFLQPEKN